jgi:hypothetical protein
MKILSFKTRLNPFQMRGFHRVKRDSLDRFTEGWACLENRLMCVDALFLHFFQDSFNLHNRNDL